MADWYVRMMQAAELSASWSKDQSKGVGCVLFDPSTHALLPQGFNGFPRGVDESIPERHERPAKYKFTVHAELNALAACARHGVKTEGMSAAVTFFPCATCAGALIQAGVKELVVHLPDYEDERWGADFKVSKQLLDEGGVALIYIVALDKGTLVSIKPWDVLGKYRKDDRALINGEIHVCHETGSKVDGIEGLGLKWVPLSEAEAESVSVEPYVPGKIYYAGNLVTFEGKTLKSLLGAQNGFGPGEYPHHWEEVPAPVAEWRSGGHVEAGDILLDNGRRYQAKWSGIFVVPPHRNSFDWVSLLD